MTVSINRPVVSFRSRSLNHDLRWLLKLNITFQGLQKIPFIILHHKMLQKVASLGSFIRAETGLS